MSTSTSALASVTGNEFKTPTAFISIPCCYIQVHTRAARVWRPRRQTGRYYYTPSQGLQSTASGWRRSQRRCYDAGTGASPKLIAGLFRTPRPSPLDDGTGMFGKTLLTIGIILLAIVWLRNMRRARLQEEQASGPNRGPSAG